MSHKQLDLSDRYQIEILLHKGYIKKDIASVLGCSPSTITRECSRYTGIYQATMAHHHRVIRRSNSTHQGMKIEGNEILKDKIVTALKQYQSPESIAGRYGDISHVSIYKWIYSAYGQQYAKYLCTKRYRKKKRKKVATVRTTIPEGVSVHMRPKRGVHWEGDLFVSSHNTVSGAVLVEQKSQYLKVRTIPNRKPSTMVTCVRRLTEDIVVDDITWDRGIENRYHHSFGTTNYFCDPHSPWQKPHVENNIGLLRKWFVPKRTNLDCMSHKEIARYVDILNHKWRKSLGYRSPHEVAVASGIIR